MNYSVAELKTRLSRHLVEIGINSRFLDNPAFQFILDEITELMERHNAFNANIDVLVTQSDNGISFSYKIGKFNYKFDIFPTSNNQFKCISFKEREEWIYGLESKFHEKHIDELVATVEKDGSISLNKNRARVDNVGMGRPECVINSYGARHFFDVDGIEVDRLNVSFYSQSTPDRYEDIDIDTALLKPRYEVDTNANANDVMEKAIASRTGIDSFSAFYVNNKTNVRYSAILPINRESGLHRLYGMNGDLPETVVIPKLSEEQVEEMIQSVRFKFQKGLRKWAVGRENFEYNSIDDQNFVYEEAKDHKNKSQ